MGRNNGSGKGLAIFALIIGFLGVGLAGFTFFGDITAPPATSQVTSTTYASCPYQSGIDASFTTITGLSIKIDVRASETVYVMFSCWSLIANAGGYLYVNLYLDTDKVTESQIATGTANSRHSIALQYYNSSLYIK